MWNDTDLLGIHKNVSKKEMINKSISELTEASTFKKSLKCFIIWKWDLNMNMSNIFTMTVWDIKLICCILKPYDDTRVICKEINY